MATAETLYFQGPAGELAADVVGAAAAPPVVFLHGGGQTRNSWGNALTFIGEAGFHGISFDLRGHGESCWVADGDYSLDRLADDLEAVLATLQRPAFLVGASLGGLTSLLVAGRQRQKLGGLVLVDVVPRIEPAGADRIKAFMRADPDGFASVEAAADAIACYLPHRPKPKNLNGLKKNLRLWNDGRYHWHWDPKFFFRESDLSSPSSYQDQLEAAAQQLQIPLLLVRGGSSDVVSPEGAKRFLALVPRAEFADIKGADHMVAGDLNDAFNETILSFLLRHRPEAIG